MSNKWTTKDIRALKSLWNKGLTSQKITEEMNKLFPNKTRGVASIRMRLWKMQNDGLIKQRKGRKTKVSRKSSKKEPTTKVNVQREVLLNPFTKIEKKKPYPNPWDRKDYIKAMKDWPTEVPVFPATQNLDDSAVKIGKIIGEIQDFLLAKNQQYGDSVLQPIRIFSTADKSEQIKVRIDDKLNRLMQGNASLESDEDVIKDLIGYLILLLIHLKYD